ncbi:S8 family serine peptidase [candidate division WOR-3 bacterium]|nr:S8 family serine peptidase [candidate division WOR-3 bacterium]
MRKYFTSLFLLLVPCFLISSDYTQGEVLVKFKTGMRGSLSFTRESSKIVSGYAELDQLFTQFGVCSFRQLVENYNNGQNYDYGLDMIYVLSYSVPENPRSFALSLSRISVVDFSEPNYLCEVYVQGSYNPFLTPNDPDFSQQWFLPNIDAQQAWDIQTGNHNERVCVIDVGMEYSHPDLSANWIRGYDFYDNDPDPDPGFWGFLETHGTHTCGCAGAVTNNSTGVASIGFGIGIIGVRAGFLFSIDEASATQGVYYACTTGASVISMSFGGPDAMNSLQTAINEAYNNHDIIVVAAAGNNGDTVPQYPANGQNVLSVTATNSSDMKASFSTYGGWVDVSAPGEEIYSTLPSTAGTYGNMSGTSMACPITAGLLALMRCQFPTETNSQIIARLFSSADSLPSEPLFAQGLMGAGKINAHRALAGGSSVEENPGVLHPFTVETISLNRGKAALLIRTGVEIDIEIELFDASGRIVRNICEKQLSGEKYINFEGLSSGSYVYRLVSGENSQTGKIEILK